MYGSGFQFDRKDPMSASSMILTPAFDGWAIRLTNGVELAHFRGFAARWRAQRYLSALIAR